MNKIGKVNFFSETGTEGGYYALQDSEHITYIKPPYGVFRGSLVYEPKDIFRQGKVENAYREDGSIYDVAEKGDVALLDITWDDGANDLARASDTITTEQWSYDGLLYLKNNDRLVIFERGIGSLALWNGKVILEEQDPYKKDSYAPFGLVSHHRPLNTDPASADEWSSWFMENRWANLDR